MNDQDVRDDGQHVSHQVDRNYRDAKEAIRRIHFRPQEADGLDDLEKEVLIASTDDETGLWMVLAIVDSLRPSFTAAEKRRHTLQTLRSLLDKKLVQAGEYLPGLGYAWWDLRQIG